MDVKTMVLDDIDRANPKSHNLITPCAPMSTFCTAIAAQILAIHAWLQTVRSTVYLRLHISVDDSVGVEVVQGLDELSGYSLHGGLGKRLVVLQDIEQLPLPVLGHNHKLFVRFKRIKHENDVVVVQPLQYTDLLPQILYIFL